MTAGDSRPIRLTAEGARSLHLAAQGLLPGPKRPAVKRDLLGAIRRMGALQIDSISVVARSPYLVLWSRVGPYQQTWLDELLAEGKLFEYWSHAACFLPIEDWPLYRRDMLYGHPRWRQWLDSNPDVAGRVRERIRESGAVLSREWEREGGRKGAGWWDWKPEKIALEALFVSGEVMVARRQNFQRVYDLRERVLPSWDDADLPSEEDVQRDLILRAVRALGVAKAQWVPAYFKRPVQGTSDRLEQLAGEGRLLQAQVMSWKSPGYVHPDNERLARRAARGVLRHESTVLLSPFDPVVWDRDRLLDLWNFHYRIEVYTPAAKRRYGYFTLPILHRGRIVGRLDPKAHRAQGVLEVRQIHLEPGVDPCPELIGGLCETLRSFAGWQSLGGIDIGESDPPELARLVREALQRSVSHQLSSLGD